MAAVAAKVAEVLARHKGRLFALVCIKGQTLEALVEYWSIRQLSESGGSREVGRSIPKGDELAEVSKFPTDSNTWDSPKCPS